MAIEEFRGRDRYKESTLRTLEKCFLHGFLFFLLMTVVAFVWMFLLGWLWVVASLFGLGLGLLLFMMGIGWTNHTIAGAIWDIHTSSRWTRLVGHGTVLFLILVLVQIPFSFVGYFLEYAASQTYFAYVVVALVALLVVAVVDGEIGRTVASWFAESESVARTLPPP